MMWLFILLVVPLGVLSQNSTGVSNQGEEAKTKLSFIYHSSDTTDLKLETLNASLCNELNEDPDMVYVSAMDPSSKQNNRETSLHDFKFIKGPNGQGSRVKNHNLEKFFKSECPLDPSQCTSDGIRVQGFTLAFWFSFVADQPRWAKNWPLSETCELVSIRNNIVITSETIHSSGDTADGTDDETEPQINLHIDFNTNQNTVKRLSLNSSSVEAMKAYLPVCINQTSGFNCSGLEERKKVGYQWNYVAFSAKMGTITDGSAEYTLQAFFNGNPIPMSNISLTDLTHINMQSGKEREGIKLNSNNDDSKCNQIGFDDFALWKRPLSEEEIIKLRITAFCKSISTRPPPRPLADLVDLSRVPNEIPPGQDKNLTFVKVTMDTLNKLVEEMTHVAEAIRDDDLSTFVEGQLNDVIKPLSKNTDYFADGNVLLAEKEEYCHSLSSTMSGMLIFIGATLLPDENKTVLAVEAVGHLEALGQSMLSSKEGLSVKTNTMEMKTKSLPANAKSMSIELDNAKTAVHIPKKVFKGNNARAVVTILKRDIVQAIGSTIPVEKPTEDSTNDEDSQTLAGDMIIMNVYGHEEGEALDEPITFTFTLQEVDEKFIYPNCCYLKMGKGTQTAKSWSFDGVTTSVNADGKIECEATHLTNFAVLMSVTEIKISAVHAQNLSTMTIVCSSISLVALFISILILFAFRELIGTRISILKHLCIAMFVAQLVFLTAIEKAAYNRKLCLVVAVFIHYLYLSVFFWMLAQGVFLYMKLRIAVRSDANIIWFCLIGWGFPAVMVTVTAGINIKSYGREDGICWMNLEGGGIWAFIGPVLAIVCINSIVIVMAMKAFTSVKSFKDKNEKEKFRSSLRAMVVMLPILGLTWVLGVFTHIPGGGGLAFMYLFAFFNALQGLFVFIFHIVFNSEIKKVIKRFLLKRSGRIAPGEEGNFFQKMLAPDSSVEKTASSGFSKSTAM